MSLAMSSRSRMSSHHHNEKYEIQIPKPSPALVTGSTFSFIAFVFLLFAFASPYWLVSWEYTFSPFKNMGLWEYCFHNYRHPHYQFDKLFTGCHYIFSLEFRIIREWLLPGWLMTVQAFYTLAFMTSLASLILLSLMITRWPLKLILDNEWLLTTVAMGGNALSAFLIFLAVAIFGGQCYRRDWLQYPNFNYLSWAYAFAVISMFIHAFAALCLQREYHDVRERLQSGWMGDENHPVIQMQQTGPGSTGGGNSNPGSDTHHFV